jgi:hypothetical protein
MKIISIIHNDITGTDLALYLKDNYAHDGSPTPPQNATTIVHTKFVMPVLQIEFWRNEKFQKYFWLGEPLSVNIDDDTDFNKRGCSWLEFLKVYESF